MVINRRQALLLLMVMLFVLFPSLTLGEIGHTGGPLTGSVDGSFDRNFAVMLDFQFRKSF